MRSLARNKRGLSMTGLRFVGRSLRNVEAGQSETTFGLSVEAIDPIIAPAYIFGIPVP
jgi:hypothetical protein